MIDRSLKEIAFRAPHLKRVLWRRKTRPTTKKSTTPKGPHYKRPSPNQTKLSKRFVRLSHSLSRRWDLFHQGSPTYRLSLWICRKLRLNLYSCWTNQHRSTMKKSGWIRNYNLSFKMRKLSQKKKKGRSRDSPTRALWRVKTRASRLSPMRNVPCRRISIFKRPVHSFFTRRKSTGIRRTYPYFSHRRRRCLCPCPVKSQKRHLRCLQT